MKQIKGDVITKLEIWSILKYWSEKFTTSNQEELYIDPVTTVCL